jgi:hypothetical protein
MKILPNQLYHIYNQGNNKETIFHEQSDYLRFLVDIPEYTDPRTGDSDPPPEGFSFIKDSLA